MFLLHIVRGNSRDGPLILLQEHLKDIPEYAVLSHRWGNPADEVTFEDFKKGGASVTCKRGYEKIRRCCEQALAQGIEYCWIDTCCIDKSNSAHLSEAINSMWKWYQNAKVCFAYLNDVPSGQHPRDKNSAFRRSEWFKRGWTLQELIAPPDVLFFHQDWDLEPIGSKSSLAHTLFQITGVPIDVLIDSNEVANISIAQKMSWAAGRTTTYPEDEAYSLMGIFDINMPIIYGEGRKAFLRLQEELLLRTTDHTIFAWNGTPEEVESCGMLASSPRAFADSAGYYHIELKEFATLFQIEQPSDPNDALLQPAYTMTNLGLKINLPKLVVRPHDDQYHLVYLSCVHKPDQGLPIIYLRRRKGRPDGHFIRTCLNSKAITHHSIYRPLDEAALKPQPLYISAMGKQQGQDRVPVEEAPITRLIIQSRIDNSNKWRAADVAPSRA